MGKVLHTKGNGGGNAQGSSYVGTFVNYAALVLAFPIANFGDVAVVENAQGTKWLPWTIGGVYYPQGTYYFNGSVWMSNVVDIAEELAGVQKSVIVHVFETSAVSNKNDFILMTTGDVSRNVNLPLSPDKDWFIEVSKRDDGLGSCFVNGNGKKINGSLEPFEIKNKNTVRAFHYDGIDNWIVK